MKFIHSLCLLLFIPAITLVDDDEIVFQQDFNRLNAEESPPEFLILEGDFIVKDHNGERLLYLSGTPLSDYGALFGPSAADGLQIAARIQSENRKRQYPRFGVGLGGVNGYKLYVTPSKRILEINKSKVTVASTAFKWQSGVWTSFRFQIQNVDGKWIMEGKAWQGEEEPKAWMVQHTVSEQPVAGKSSIWGTPYSSKDILFDDIIVVKASS